MVFLFSQGGDLADLKAKTALFLLRNELFLKSIYKWILYRGIIFFNINCDIIDINIKYWEKIIIFHEIFYIVSMNKSKMVVIYATIGYNEAL